MLHEHIRLNLKFLSLQAVAIFLVSFWFLHSMRVDAQVSPSSKVRDLQEQRLAVLREAANMVRQQYQNGQMSSEELWSATRARDEAELDLGTSNKERIVLLEKIVSEAKTLEEQSAKLAANKLLPETSFLKVKADRLQQEILLEQVRTK